MKNLLLIVSTGFALFSMFFGSGNLVFPLTVGKESGGHFWVASLGIFLTGVLVPFLGVLAMTLYKGDSRQFFGSMGKPAAFWFPLVALSLMGPFGVLARCITVAHGSFRLLFPHASLIVFSLVLCVILYLVTMNKNRIVPLLGSFLTPFLLISLAAIAIMGFWFADSQPKFDQISFTAFKNGVFQGYQTMDLLAAFFFSTFVINHLQKRLPAGSDQTCYMKVFLKSTLLGAFLLTIVYVALVFLGSVYAPQLADTPPQELLGVVAYHAMGKWSAPIVCTAVVLACFTTAVVLTTLFADFLKSEVAQHKIGDSTAMLVTLSIAFCVSTLEFSGISRFLGPILETLYPSLIVLTVLNICSSQLGWSRRRWPVAMTLLAKLCFF